MRLDVYLQEHGGCKSRTRAKAYITEGKVKVNGKTITKAGYDISDSDVVELLASDVEYVGRAARKLEGALDVFGIDVSGKKCIDVGASTGGFTQVLLMRGAESVVAVDSGHGQLDASLVSDDRVRNVEGCNARYMTASEVGDGFSLAVMDVSFISQTYIHPALFGLLSDGARLISLVKPQFELDGASVGKGVVRDPAARLRALSRVYDSVLIFGYRVTDAIPSSIKGGDGNSEYLFLIEKGEEIPSVRAKLAELAKQ